MEPEDACPKALSGGYIVHPPEAGPVEINKEDIITILARKKNQYESIFRKGEAISLAPICKGIRKLAKVPLNPAVNTKNTSTVPCMVINA
jgi:hypothetical protein